MAEVEEQMVPADAAEMMARRIGELEREVAELRRYAGKPYWPQPQLAPDPFGEDRDPDGAEAPPCLMPDTEMRLSPDQVVPDSPKLAWSFDKAAGSFRFPYIMLGNNLTTVSTGNANISLPASGSSPVDYYIHVYHGTSGSPTVELVTSSSSNTDTDTYIKVATLSPTGQTDGIFSVAALPLYAW